jgi:signal transduction histidine kinase
MIFDGLSNYYTNTQNWKSLAEVKDSLQQVYKRLINKETEEKIAQYNVEYETSKKEQLITAQQNRLQKARYLTLFISIVALLLGVSIFALVRNYKIKKAVAVNDAIQAQKDSNVQAVFESEQTERIRIARDLHDSVGQKLSVLKMYLNNRENDAAKTPDLLDETIQEVRNISHNLLPEELNFGLLNALKTDIEKIENTGNFKVTTQIEDAAYQNISLLTSLNIVRILRELLSNLVKHSKATEIGIHVFIAQNNLHLQLKDNGIGIPSKAIEDSKGIGWKNIFTRINMLKGTIKIENTAPGTSIQIEIPIA